MDCGATKRIRTWRSLNRAMFDADARASLERFIVKGTPLPNSSTLAQSRFAALAYTELPWDDPRKLTHSDAFTTATALHLVNKAALRALVRAWHDAGIEIILFKGFYLAELVYDHPAQRHYGDVDVIMRPHDWEMAERLARDLGWTILWNRCASLYAFNHEEAVLALGRTVVEVHRFVIDSLSPFDGLQRRLTSAAWDGSRPVAWENTSFRALSHVDSVLLGLVLARAWSGGDDWFLKPSDYLDMKAISARFGLRREDVERRARELRCSRSLELFLRRCDPWQERLDLRSPTALERQRWYLAIVPERGHLAVERSLVSALRFPGTLLDVVRQLPLLIRTSQMLRIDHAWTLTDQTVSSSRTTTTLRAKERIVRGIKWGAYLLRLGRDSCLLRSYALFEALRAEGLSIRLIEGRTDGVPHHERHARIEVDGVSMRDLEDVRSCRVDEVTVRLPDEGAASQA